ncbi:hypothetical protein [Massilibacteroides sp.]|uniref:hypothetical protein n=1 Tax=Massilibacteroides sp. TaxID=2034766 RepID=UPI002626E103|nr:hypothetical protein [Massilibacteroides sp.]MDD4515533.1 hypothetical protein [Massilibacteroides sp.]
MKAKILPLLIITLLITLFSSCEGRDGIDGVGSWDVFEIKIEGRQWEWDPERELFYFYYEDPGITSFIATDGLVQAAIRYDDTYFPLPYTRHLYDGGYLTETVNYEYGAGWIRFNFSASDLFDTVDDYQNYQPGTHFIKVTLLW